MNARVPALLGDIDALYECSEHLVVVPYQIKHDPFRRFSMRLRRFEQVLGEAAEDEYWRDFLRKLRRYRFELSAAPLPFNHPSVYYLAVIERGWSKERWEQSLANAFIRQMRAFGRPRDLFLR